MKPLLLLRSRHVAAAARMPERELWGRQRNRTVRLLPLPRPPPSLACREGRVRPPPGAGNCGLSHMWKGMWKGRQGEVGGGLATGNKELRPVANGTGEELWEAVCDERPPTISSSTRT